MLDVVSRAPKGGNEAFVQSPAVLVEYLVLCLAWNEGGQYPPRDSGDERPDCQQLTRMGIGYKSHDGRFADLDVSLVSSRVGKK